MLNCKLAVIADGGDSPMRRALGIEARVGDYAQTAIIANVAFSQAHQGVAYERFTVEGPLALLPLGEKPEARTAALVWTLPEPRAIQVQALPEREFLAELQASFGHRLGRFERVSQRYAYPLRLIEACEQVRSHLVLVGNAAHFLHPVAGQGFNLALRDCGALAEALVMAERRGQPLGELGVLQGYQRQQAQDQALTTAFSDRLVRVFSSDYLPHAALRHLGLLGLELVPALKQGFATTAMGRGGRRADWRPRPGN
jgi:ubiquinone biosynthesis UbiH/UbiF/VisC/COQ6 family hydroxylase